MGNSPTTIFSGTTGPKGDRPGPDRVFGRLLLYVVLVVFFPVTTLVFFGWLALFVYARMPWWVPAPVALAVWLLTFQVDGGGLAGAIASHANMWGDILGGLRSPEGFFSWLGSHWLTVIAAQLWFAGLFGTSLAAGVAAWKWMRRPRWEERTVWPGPVLRARVRKTGEQIAAGQGSPTDGVTVGVSVDRRDPRFAGGKPGAPYGRRTVLLDTEAAGHCLIVGGAGAGKALAVTELVPTPSGFVPMGEIRVGDYVFGASGAPVRVTQAHDVMVGHDCFGVEFSDGTVIVADAEHLWTVREDTGRGWGPAWLRRGGWVTVTTADLHAGVTAADAGRGKRYVVPEAGLVQYPERDLPADPYTVGRCLNSRTGSVPADADADAAGAAEVLIPDEYLLSSERQRRALLAGLLDADGTFDGGAFVSYTARGPGQAGQVASLLASLGYRPVLSQQRALPSRSCPEICHVVTFTAREDVFADGPLADAHRAGRVRARGRVGARHVTAVRAVASVPVRCIAVDAPDRLFLVGRSYVATHNTTTMLMGMRDVMRRGHGLIVIDCKGGPDVPEQVAEWASRYGRRFYHWDMIDPRSEYTGPADGPAFYDPIGRGDPSRRKDLIIGSQRWDVEYYKTVIGDYLQTAFTVMNLVPAADGTDTLRDISDLLSPPALMRRAAPIPRDKYPSLALALERIASMGDQERSGVNNMYARLNTLTQSIAGPWLKRDPEGQRDVDLLRIADQGDVVVFSLDTSNYEETSALLAGLIVQDLKTVSSALREQRSATPVHVYIDEFSAVDATNIYGLLAKARDARMSVTLATQALADLKRREQHFDSQVVGIVGSFLIHRANSEEDARIYAGLSGMTRKMLHRIGVENTTGTLGTLGAASSTGSGFLEEKEMYRVDPGVFQGLQQGQCVMITKMPVERIVAPVQVVREEMVRATTSGDGAINPERLVREPEFSAQEETFQTAFAKPRPAGDSPGVLPDAVLEGTSDGRSHSPQAEDVSSEVVGEREPAGSAVQPVQEAPAGTPGKPARPTRPKPTGRVGIGGMRGPLLPDGIPAVDAPPTRRPVSDSRDGSDEWTTL
jgi:hypothetical protein